jgi:DNA-binding beta-propeller fold protein YncE
MPSAASAAQAHAFSFSFGSPGSGAGQLSLVPAAPGSGMAVNDETGDVYVADTANNRIDEFEVNPGSSSAVFLRAWGWGVDQEKPEAKLQSCTEATGCQAGLAGTNPGELDAPVFVAVDNSAGESHGDVYVAVTGESLESPKNLVSKFDAEGKLIESWGVKGQLNQPEGEPEHQFGEPEGIAVDSAGALWTYVGQTVKAPGPHLYEFGQDGVFKELGPSNNQDSLQGIALDSTGHLYLSEQGAAVEKLPPSNRVFVGSLTGLAVAPLTSDLYVDKGSSIADVSFQCEPSNAGCTPAQVFGPPHLSAAAGLAVDSQGVVYAANTALGQVAVFTVSIDATIAAASEVKARSATLNGEVNPQGGEISKCSFEYGETTGYGKSAPCEPAVPYSGKAPVKVHADVAGLTSGVKYHFRLHVSNSSGEEIGSEDEGFATLPTAVIEEAVAQSVEATTAVLAAKVNPRGVAGTLCTIEYGTSTSYGTTVPCEPEQLSGELSVAISRHLAGLTAETTYHWRVVVADVNGTVAGADNTFVYIPPGRFEIEEGCANETARGESNPNPVTKVALASELADCRGYEMVSPVQKNGALLTPVFGGLSPDIGGGGQRVIVSSLTCFDEPQSCTGARASLGPPFEFARTNAGWATHPLAPPASEFELNSVWGYSADSGLVLYSSPVPPGVTDEFYARQPDGTMQAIGPIGEGEAAGIGAIAGIPSLATSDLSHLVYGSKGALWPPFASEQGESLYEYAGFRNAKPFPVGVTGSQGSEDLISVCGTGLPEGIPQAVKPQSLSADGRIVYFAAYPKRGVGPCPGGSGANAGTEVPVEEAYARIDGESSDAHTIPISEPKAPQTLSSAPPDENCTSVKCQKNISEQANWRDGRWTGASEDGTKTLLLSTQQLTDEASEDPQAGDTARECAHTTGAGGCNLYLYDLNAPAGHNLIDVSGGDSSGLGAEVQGVMALSGDGSHVYFVAKGVLSAGQNHAGLEPVAGADNLYAYERDGAHPTGHVVFIATLPGDEKGLPRAEARESQEWTAGPLGRANVSANGHVFVFTSHGALTSDDTRGVGPAQVYRYDSESGELLRVSIGERGFNDNGNAGAGEASLGEAGGLVPRRRDGSMSSDGSKVFFQSPAGLTPGALDNVSVNGGHESEDLAQNIYEWEAQGKGACKQAGGCVHLISDGRDASEVGGVGHRTLSSVELLGADSSGENVFFTTANPLVAQDTDTELDIYDAHVGGGFPRSTPPIICEADNCRPEPPPPPILGPLGSLTFNGPGNSSFEAPKPPPGKPKTAAQIRAEKLAKALKACHRVKRHNKRRACERTAHRKYGPLKAAKKSKKTNRRRSK